MSGVISIQKCSEHGVFKTCTLCAHRWETVADLIRDNNLVVNGYQPSFSNSREGLFLLTHVVEGCGTTIGLHAGYLLNLYARSGHQVENVAYTGHCDGHCRTAAAAVAYRIVQL